MATAQLAGQENLVGMDWVRADPASTLLHDVSVAPSRTAARLAGRFGLDRLSGIEAGLAGVYDRWLALAPASIREPLVVRPRYLSVDPA